MVTWHPRKELIIYINEKQIEKYGGFKGIRRNPNFLTDIIKEVRNSDGDIFHKASILLKRLITARIFEDGNHRTAYVAVKYFLKENGEDVYIENYLEGQKFLKMIHAYSIVEIAEWLKHGSH